MGEKWNSFFLYGLLCTFIGGMVGCGGIPIRSEEGKTYYLILGVGLVSTEERVDPSLQMVQTNTLGVCFSDHTIYKFGLGYTSHTTLSIGEEGEKVEYDLERFFVLPAKIYMPAEVEIQSVS